MLKSGIILFVRKQFTYFCLQGTRNSRYCLTVFPALFFHSLSPVLFTFVFRRVHRIVKSDYKPRHVIFKGLHS